MATVRRRSCLGFLHCGWTAPQRRQGPPELRSRILGLKGKTTWQGLALDLPGRNDQRCQGLPHWSGATRWTGVEECSDGSNQPEWGIPALKTMAIGWLGLTPEEDGAPKRNKGGEEKAGRQLAGGWRTCRVEGTVTLSDYVICLCYCCPIENVGVEVTCSSSLMSVRCFCNQRCGKRRRTELREVGEEGKPPGHHHSNSVHYFIHL